MLLTTVLPAARFYTTSLCLPIPVLCGSVLCGSVLRSIVPRPLAVTARSVLAQPRRLLEIVILEQLDFFFYIFELDDVVTSSCPCYFLPAARS